MNLKTKIDKKVWIVWNKKGPKPPIISHNSFERALEAAKKLAYQIPDTSFFVMEAVARRKLEL